MSMLLAVVLSVENDNSGLRDIDSINKKETPVKDKMWFIQPVLTYWAEETRDKRQKRIAQDT